MASRTLELLLKLKILGEPELKKLEAQLQALNSLGAVDLDLGTATGAVQKLREEVEGLTEELSQAFQQQQKLGARPKPQGFGGETKLPDASAAAQSVRGLDEALEDAERSAAGLREKLQMEGSGGSVAQKIAIATTAFNGMLAAIQAIRSAGTQAYGALITQNEQLRQQILSTQATLAATNDVLVGGEAVADPGAAIKALEAPINSALQRMRENSLELVGVTSADLVPLYQIIAGQSANIGASLDEAGDLALDFAASLGTLSIPIDQARQEINSIFSGQINSDSALANAIGITNEDVRLWQASGSVVEELRGRLESFREGNKLAAQSVSGLTSNIREVFEVASQQAGAPILDELIKQLDKVENFLLANQDTINDFAVAASERFLDLAFAVGDAAAELGELLLPVLQELGPAGLVAINTLIDGFILFANGIEQAATAAQNFRDTAGPAFEAIDQAVRSTVPVLGLLDDGVGSVSDRLQKLLDRVRTAIAFLSKLNPSLSLGGGLDDNVEAFESLRRASAQLATEGTSTQAKLKKAIEETTAATENGGELTDDQRKKFAALADQSDATAEALRGQLRELNQFVPITTETRQAQELQRAELERQIDALEEDSAALRSNAQAVELVARKNSSLEGAIRQSKEALADRTQAITNAEKEALLESQKLFNENQISYSDLEQSKRDATLTRLTETLAAEKAAQSELEALGVQPNDQQEKERQRALAAAKDKVLSAELALEQNAQQERERVQAKAQKEQERTATQRQALQAAAAEQQALLDEQGLATDAELQAQKLKATEDRIDREIAAEQEKQAILSQAPQTSDTLDAIAQSENKITQLRTEASENRKAITVQAEREAIAEVQRIREQAEQKLNLSTAQSNLAIEQAAAEARARGDARVDVERETQTRSIRLERETAQQRLDLAKKYLADLEALPDPLDPDDARERAKQISDAQAQVFGATTQALQAQARVEQDVADQAVRNIERRQQAEKTASDAALGALGRKADLLESERNLQRSIDNLEQVRLSNALKLAGSEEKREEIQKRIAQAQLDNLDRRQKAEREALKLTQRRAQLEQRIEIGRAKAELAKAKARGATDKELDALRGVLGLQLEIAKDLGTLQRNEREALINNQQGDRENAEATLAEAERAEEERRKKENQRRSTNTIKTRTIRSGSSRRKSKEEEEADRRADEQLDRASRRPGPPTKAQESFIEGDGAFQEFVEGLPDLKGIEAQIEKQSDPAQMSAPVVDAIDSQTQTLKTAIEAIPRPKQFRTGTGGEAATPVGEGFTVGEAGAELVTDPTTGKSQLFTGESFIASDRPLIVRNAAETAKLTRPVNRIQPVPTMAQLNQSAALGMAQPPPTTISVGEGSMAGIELLSRQLAGMQNQLRNLNQNTQRAGTGANNAANAIAQMPTMLNGLTTQQQAQYRELMSLTLRS